MPRQEFNTVDVVRLEVAKDPTGLVNLVQNPNGELGGWGWITPVLGSKLESAYPGSPPVELRYVTVAGANYLTTEAMPIVAGQYAAARWNATLGTGYLRARFEWLDAAGSVLSSSAQTDYLSMVGEVESMMPVVAPASTVAFRLRFDLYANNAGANYTSASFFGFYAVTAAVAATPAELSTARTNLHPRPSFEVDTTGWSVTNATLSRVTTPAGYSGSACAKITTTGTSSPTLSSGAARFAATPGLAYSAALWVRSATVPRSFGMKIACYANPTDTVPVIASGLGPTVVSSTSGWTRVEINNIVAPVYAPYLSVSVTVFGVAAGEVHYVDAVIAEQAAVAGTYFDGSTPDDDSTTYGWEGAANASASFAVSSELAYIPPVEYLDIIGESHEIRVPRDALNVGTLSATVLSRTLDPSQSTLLRPGRRARLSALVAGVWETLIGGKLLEADVSYEVKDPRVPTEKQARIVLTLVDPTQTVANAGRPEGVATIDELPFVLEGAGVPWNVNGSGNQVPNADVTTYNEGASALDQVALTRDTGIGYAWMSRAGVLNVWDRDEIPSGAPVLLDEDDYSDLDLSFSTKDAINEVQITVQSLGADGTTTETVYGPYTDDTSIKQWGRFRKEFTVTGLDSAAVEALAAAILDAAATPRIRVNSLTLPLTNLDRVEAHALRDLYDEVRVSLDSLGIDEVLRVTGIEHVITTESWTLRLDFADEGGVATPTLQPPVQSGIRPDVGVIELFAGATPPPGKLLCDGSSYAVADYPYLFAVIGYTYGGAGAFFDVPDLTDRFPIGSGSKALGTIGGASTAALTAANLPAHTHPIERSAAANTGGGTRVALGNTSAAANGVTEPNSGTAAPFSVLNPWLSLNFVIRAA